MAYTRNELEDMGRLQLRRIAKQRGFTSEEIAELDTSSMIDAILMWKEITPPPPPADTDYAFLRRLGMRDEVLETMSAEELNAQAELFEEMPYREQHWTRDLLVDGGPDVRWCKEFMELKKRLRLQSESFSLISKDGEVYMWIRTAPSTDLGMYQVMSDELQGRCASMLLPPPLSINGEVIKDNQLKVLQCLSTEWTGVKALTEAIPSLSKHEVCSAATALWKKEIIDKQKIKTHVHYRLKEDQEVPNESTA
jgi:hypothetical protein